MAPIIIGLLLMIIANFLMDKTQNDYLIVLIVGVAMIAIDIFAILVISCFAHCNDYYIRIKD